jgi:hypothetical protein
MRVACAVPLFGSIGLRSDPPIAAGEHRDAIRQRLYDAGAGR